MKRADYLVPAGLILLSLVPAIVGIGRILALATGAAATDESARFVDAPLPVMLHVPAAILYSMVGALQFSPGLRRRAPGWHRHAGRVLVPLGATVAASGLWMAHFTPWPPGDGVAVYLERIVAGALMLASLALGIGAIRRRDFAAHGRWMTRAYAIGLGAGTQVLTHLPWFLLAGTQPDAGARGVMMGAGWFVNMLVAEWAIRRDESRPAQGASPEPRRESRKSLSAARSCRWPAHCPQPARLCRPTAGC